MTMPAMITAQPEPPDAAEPVAGEREAEERRPDRLERERERGLRRRRPPLRPGLHEERERAREDAGHEQRAPDRPAVRRLELPGGERDQEETGERGEHLDERERDRVVERREALHQHDLQRVDRRAREHQQVSARRARVHAGEQREPGRRERHADPGGTRSADPEEREREQRRQHDVHPGDEAGRRDRRPLEPGRLERVAGAEQRAGERARGCSTQLRAPATAADRRARACRSRSRSADARNANSGYSATASLTCTNVTPQTAVTATRARSARTRAIKRCHAVRCGQLPSRYRLRSDSARHLRPAASRPAHLGHRPLQLPLRLLHAEGGLRPRPSVPRPARAADLRGDHPRRAGVRRRGRARRSGSPAASRSCAATSSS